MTAHVQIHDVLKFELFERFMPPGVSCTMCLENKSNSVQTSHTFWRYVRVLLIVWSLQWHSFMLLMLFCSQFAKNLHFSEVQLVCYRRTNIPSYRNARTRIIRTMTIVATLRTGPSSVLDRFFPKPTGYAYDRANGPTNLPE